MDNNNLLMIIDGFQYETIDLIKNYNYKENIILLSMDIKKKIDKILEQSHDIYYGYQNLLLQLLCGISDGLFNKYGPDNKKIYWNNNSMEKIYCNSLTSCYSLVKNLENIIKNHQWIPHHIIYSHWLFFNTVGYNLDKAILLYFQSQLNIPYDNKFNDINNTATNSQLLHINYFNYLFIFLTVLIFLTGNKILYWYWINNLIY